MFACTLAGLRYEIGSSVGRRDERNTSFVDREVTRSWKKKKRFVAGGEAASMQIARDLWGLFSSRVPWSGEKEFRSWVEIGAKSSRGDEEEEDLVSLESGNKEWLLFGQIKRGLRGGSI